MANGFDLSAIIDMANGLSQSQAQQTEQIAANQAQQGQRAQIQAEATRKAGDLTAKANLTTRRAEMEAVNVARKNATSMGMNALDMSEIITSTSEQLRADRLAYQAASQEVQQIEENANLLANPLGWLNDVLNGDEARARRDNIAKRHDDTARQLSNMHSLTQTNVQTQLSIAETQTEASINQLAESERLAAEVDAQQRSIEALGYTSASIDTLRQHGAAEFNRRMAVNSAIRQDQQFQQSMAMQRKRFEMEQKKFAKEEKEEESWQTTVQNVHIAQRALGQEPMDEGMIRRAYGQNTPVGEAIRDLEYRGWRSANQEKEAFIADTPFEAVQVIDRYGANLPAAAQPAIEILDTAQAQLAQERKIAEGMIQGTTTHGLNKDNLDSPEAVAAAYNSIADELMQTRNDNRTAIGIPISNLLQEFPHLAQMPIGEKVLAPLLESGVTELKPDAVFSNTASLYAKGQMTHNEARDGLVEFFNSSLALEGAYNWFPQLGLRQTDHFMAAVPERLPTGDPVGGLLDSPTASFLTLGGAGHLERLVNRNRRVRSETRNLTDPTDVSNSLNAYKSSTLSTEMQRAGQESGIRPGPAAAQ